MKVPPGGSYWSILLITLITAAGLASLAAAAQRWALRRNTTAESLLFLLSGLLLVFPSLIEALMETITGLDIPYPAPFGLAIGLCLLLKQKLMPAPAAPAAG